jgi:hypothetical protein
MSNVVTQQNSSELPKQQQMERDDVQTIKKTE